MEMAPAATSAMPATRMMVDVTLAPENPAARAKRDCETIRDTYDNVTDNLTRHEMLLFMLFKKQFLLL